MRLVIQGVDTPEQLHHITSLCGDPRPSDIAPYAYSLRFDGKRMGEIEAYCAGQAIDCAFVPKALALEHFGLVMMDMDSTLISIETIDEIADLQGLTPQVAGLRGACAAEPWCGNAAGRVAPARHQNHAGLRRLHFLHRTAESAAWL